MKTHTMRGALRLPGLAFLVSLLASPGYSQQPHILDWNELSDDEVIALAVRAGSSIAAIAEQAPVYSSLNAFERRDFVEELSRRVSDAGAALEYETITVSFSQLPLALEDFDFQAGYFIGQIPRAVTRQHVPEPTSKGTIDGDFFISLLVPDVLDPYERQPPQTDLLPLTPIISPPCDGKHSLLQTYFETAQLDHGIAEIAHNCNYIFVHPPSDEVAELMYKAYEDGTLYIHATCELVRWTRPEHHVSAPCMFGDGYTVEFPGYENAIHHLPIEHGRSGVETGPLPSSN